MKPKKPKASPQKQTKGAGDGLCVHRVALTSYCSKCGA